MAAFLIAALLAGLVDRYLDLKQILWQIPAEDKIEKVCELEYKYKHWTGERAQ